MRINMETRLCASARFFPSVFHLCACHLQRGNSGCSNGNCGHKFYVINFWLYVFYSLIHFFHVSAICFKFIYGFRCFLERAFWLFFVKVFSPVAQQSFALPLLVAHLRWKRLYLCCVGCCAVATWLSLKKEKNF